MSKREGGDCGYEVDTVGLRGTWRNLCETWAKLGRNWCEKSEALFACKKTVQKRAM